MKTLTNLLNHVSRVAVLLLLGAFSVAMANTPPVADAGPDQELYMFNRVTLDGSGSYDTDLDPLGYSWSFVAIPEGSAAVISDPTIVNPTFNTDLKGDYVVQLVVNDGTVSSEPDSMTVSAAGVPVATKEFIDDPVAPGDTVTLRFKIENYHSTDGATGIFFTDNLSEILPGEPDIAPPPGWSETDICGVGSGVLGSDAFLIFTGGNLVAGASCSFDVSLLVPEEAAGGTYTNVTSTVTSTVGSTVKTSAPAEDDLTIIAENSAPTAAPTATPNSGPAPLTVAFAANAVDPDDDPLTYLWNFGDPASPDNSSALADPTHVYELSGTYEIWLTVSDGTNEIYESVTVVVSEEQLLSTTRATVVGTNKGAITYLADIGLSVPQSYEVITLRFDGIKLFSAPFSDFTAELAPGIYMITKRWVTVRIDFVTNTLYVNKDKANLRKFDNTDGVDVELSWGNETAVDQFMMEQVAEDEWEY